MVPSRCRDVCGAWRRSIRGVSGRVSELARGLGVEHVTLVGYDDDGVGVVLAARDSPDRTALTVGERFPLDG